MEKKGDEDSDFKLFEPLPYMDYKLFEEKFDPNDMKIHINPHAQKKRIFLPNQSIRIKIQAIKKPLHGYMLHPYIYKITIQYLKHTWHVHRNMRDFREVHKLLCRVIKAELGVKCSEIPKYDQMISENKIAAHAKNLSNYLERVVKYPPYRDHPAVQSILGVSPLSFTSDLGPSLIEGVLNKKSGDILLYGGCRQKSKVCCQKLKIWHDKRWFCLKDTYLVYMDQIENFSISFVMLVDAAFECSMQISAGAYHAIEIKNSERRLVLKCRNSHQQQEWFNEVTQMLHTTGKYFHERNYLTFESYAPLRLNQMCRWYVNASMYMEHIMHALNNAKEEIYIADWWLCPELYLKRPTDDPEYRLDRIIIRKAREGVRVYILLYKEITFFLNLHTVRTRQILTEFGMNPNVKILRHPDHFFDGVFLWSHHEKFVVVDQSVAFLGGIDLCYGRWDDESHRLIDLGRKQNVTTIENPNGVKSIHVSCSDSNLVAIGTTEIREEPDDEDENAKIGSSQQLTNATQSQQKLSPLANQKPPTTKPRLMQKRISENDMKIIRAFTSYAHQAPDVNFKTQTLRRRVILMEKSGSENSESMPTMSGSTKPAVMSTIFNDSPALNTNDSLRSDKTKNTSNGNLRNMHSLSTPSNALSAFSKMKRVTKKINWPKSSYAAQSMHSHISNSSQKVKTCQIKVVEGDKNARKSIPVTDQVNSEEMRKPIRWVTTKNDMMRNKNKKLSLNTIFRSGGGGVNLRSNINDDIYDRWHDSKTNEGFAVEGEFGQPELLPKNSDAGYYYWVGKDYANSYREDFKDVHEYLKDQFDRTEVPRMPWRDQGCVLFGHSARDLARHFIQRWNQCKTEQVPYLDIFPYLIPKCYSQPFVYNSREWFKDELFKCSVQMLRSASDWSAGISNTENSILNAYCELIKKSEHFIYMENQFFITTTNPAKDGTVRNPIGLAIVDRIKVAHESKQNFRIIILLPLLPGFDRIHTIKAVQYYNLRSIKFGECSIYKELRRAGIEDPSEYITFHGLRNWSVLMGKLVQEIIYVHSKLMIVDDRYVLCGSANINDRSLLGRRDSEVCAFIKDEEFVESVLDNKKVRVGKYAFSLRQKIFKLHLGIYFNNPTMVNVNDCVSSDFYRLFKSVSHQNTLIYDEVFKCLPSDKILNFNDLKNFTKQPSLSKTEPADAKLKLEKSVMGLIVDFPLNFLSHEKNFFPDLDTPEGLVPTEMWT